jgi:hypothetical protein
MVETQTGFLASRVEANQAEMKANKAKTDANLRDMREEITARLETEIETNNEKFVVLRSTLISRMDIHLARTEANQEEIIVKMDTHQESMRASINAWRKETTACQEAMEACLDSKEPTSLEVVSEVEHEEVPKEEAAVKTVGALKKRHLDRHLAIGHRGQPKKQTQGNGGSWKKLAIICRKMTHQAGVTWHKGRGHKGPTVEQRRRKNWTTENFTRGTPKARTFGKKRRVPPECNNDIRDRGTIRQLHLRLETTTGNSIRGRSTRQELLLGSVKTYENHRQTHALDIMKRTVGTSIKLWKINVRTLWRGRAPPKREKRWHAE